MHARKWLPALLAVACLTGCGGKTNDSSQPATTTTITNSPCNSTAIPERTAIETAIVKMLTMPEKQEDSL